MAFFDLIRGDKTKLIWFVTQIFIALLFAIALLLPYMVSINLIDGSLSSSDFPGGGFYTFIFFISVLGFAYLSIMGHEKHARLVFVGQAVLATLIFFYSLLFHKVGLASASNGFGKILEFFLMIAFWFLIFGKKHIEKWIQKVVPAQMDTQSVPVEPKNEQPNIGEPRKSYIPKSIKVEEKPREIVVEELNPQTVEPEKIEPMKVEGE